MIIQSIKTYLSRSGEEKKQTHWLSIILSLIFETKHTEFLHLSKYSTIKKIM